MLTLILCAALAEPTPLASKIEDVTLYGSSALVHRATTVPGSGAFLLSGLPLALDQDNVRVRCFGGDVLSVEVREREQATAPSERVEALRARLKVLGRDLQSARDDVGVLEAMNEHLKALSGLDTKDFRADLQSKSADTSGWMQSFAFLQQKFLENAKALREARWKLEDAERAYKEVEVEMGNLTRGGSVRVRDVLFDVAANGEARVDVEYLVSGTGWQPTYDLRTASDLASVDVGYRAKIWQKTGEDWNDVAIALSTAAPQRGAQGPDPVPSWITLYEPRSGSINAPASEAVRDLRGLGYLDKSKEAGEAKDDSAPPSRAAFATVESQGLSVRFQLARAETIESREQPTTVLVGRASFAVETERSCTPALDPTVWLRGKAKNTSAWTMLPGTAAVFLGADYLGAAQIELVQPGQELVLHLGADPMLTVKREQTEDLSKGPGFLSSRAEKIEGWRVHVENHGAVTKSGDGAVDVIVREVLPRSRDERIDVELTKSEPKESKDERWKQDRDEKGIHTWVLRIPREGASDLVWQVTITYPKGAELVRE